MRDREGLMKALPWLATPVLIAIFLGIWQFVISVVGVSQFILPSPAAVWTALTQILGQ